MEHKLAHAVERKVFEHTIKKAVKKIDTGGEDGYLELIDAIQRVMGDTWEKETYDRLRDAFSKEGKWKEYVDNLLDTVDRDYLLGLLMAFGYEGGFTGYSRTKKMSQKYGVHIPWIILFDPTSACNLHCTGCWASKYSKQLNLSYEDMDSIVSQGKELGIHTYVMTGGEPLVRKADIAMLAEKHEDYGFMIFTNGTLVDQDFCDEMKRCKNIVLCISIEGNESATDIRRGRGTFQKVMKAMELLRENRLTYGTSICYTRQNFIAVTSDEFFDFLIDQGVSFSWYFHYMPVGMDAAIDLLPTAEQREYMYFRIREVRAFEGGKPIFCMDFQNDGEFVDGCVAGGKYYCHINPNGDVEPCVFIHYSCANIHEQSLLDCLRQPLFKEYQKRQPFNDNLLRPCPMLENPVELLTMLDETRAVSTDMLEPEDGDHLCSKCFDYAVEWAPIADRLWKETHR